MYADANGDRIVCGDAEEYGNADTRTGLYAPREVHFGEMPWVRRDWLLKDEASKRQAIMDGALYPYVKNVKLYKCPTGLRDELRIYTIVDAINCVALKDCGEEALMIKNRLQIKKAAERYVFLDDGGTGGRTLGGWTNYVQEDKWWDPPPVRHGRGTTFGFADGHSEHVKWMDDRTLDFAAKGKAFSEEQPGNRDIMAAQVGSWGSPPARPLMDQ
jgi:prepilin-type processing-associated H-X9-DG protein